MAEEFSYSDRLRMSTDPSTPPAQLAELAHKHAELRPLIAANPSAYPGLLDWLAQLGEPAVIAAIAARVSAPAAVAVAPVAPVGNQYTASIGAPVAPVAPAGVAIARPVRDPARPRFTFTRNRIIALTAGAAALLLVVGGGVFAVNTFLTGGSATDSAKAFPASTYTWAEVAIDPSPGQKLAAVQLLSQLPELKNLVDDEGPTIDYSEPDLKRSLWDYIFDNRDFDLETSLSYQTDIKPWLGSRVAAGLVGSAPSAQDSYLIAIEATNTQLGVEAMLTLLQDRDAAGVQVSARNGYVLISSDQLDLTKAFAGGSLADTDKFKGSTSRIGSWGLAAYWQSPRGAIESQLAWVEQEPDSLGSASLQDLKDEYFSDVEFWQQEIADYRASCPRNATYYSSYCDTYSEPTESDFYDSYNFYPSDWEAAAQQAYDDSLAGVQDVLDSAHALVDSLSPNGSLAGAIRVTGDAVEFVEATAGLNLPDFAAPQHGAAMADLPASTIAAANVSQFGSMVDTAISPEYYAVAFANQFTTSTYTSGYTFQSLVSYEGDQFPRMVSAGRDNFEQGLDDNLGIRMPDELNAIFGTDALLAVDKDFSCGVYDFTYTDGDCSSPNVGVIVYSADAGETSSRIDQLISNVDDSYYDLGIDVTKSGDRVAISRGDYASSLLEPSAETLGQSAKFSAALPDLGGSFASAYVDVAAVVSEIRDQAENYPGSEIPSSQLKFLDYFDGIDSAGLTVTKLGGGDVVMRLRVVVGAK